MSARLEYTSEHQQFRELVHDFVQQTVVPAHERWEKAGFLDRSLFTEAGKLGLLGFQSLRNSAGHLELLVCDPGHEVSFEGPTLRRTARRTPR
jgi:alkylation response protein AidB-like acyl-CoA dehydrogenase